MHSIPAQSCCLFATENWNYLARCSAGQIPADAFGLAAIGAYFSGPANAGCVGQAAHSPASGVRQALVGGEGVALSIDERWKECHLGGWDGLTFQEIAVQDPEALAHYYQQPAEIVLGESRCCILPPVLRGARQL